MKQRGGHRRELGSSKMLDLLLTRLKGFQLRSDVAVRYKREECRALLPIPRTEL